MPWRLGIDENGLGPQLGPLIVTGVMARLTDAAQERFEHDAASFLHERLADSKQLVDHRHVALGEAWARGLPVGANGITTPDALVQALSLHDRDHLLAPCPKKARAQCWSTDVEVFDATDEQVAAARSDLAALRDHGVDVVWAKSVIVCVKRINEQRAQGRSRLDIDLRSMEELIAAARSEAGEDVQAACGKVGGMQRYAGRFSVLSDRLYTILEESRAQSSYRIAGIGTVRFLRDAEGRDPLVALASLVGKYMRETLMRRIVGHYRRQDGTLRDASGYNDPVTDAFVRATGALRERGGIPDECFLREQGRKDR